MTYEERLKQVVKDLYIPDSGWRGKHIVALQVEAIREALNNCEASRILNPNNNWEDYLKQNGYIPEKEEE